jgi:cytochrome P450
VSETAISFREGLADKDRFIARLHQEAPIYKDPVGYWIVSRFDDVRAIALDHAHFSSSPNGGEGEASRALNVPLISDDPPRHPILRSLLAKAFTSAAMESMRPAIERMAHDLVAAIPAGQEIDVVRALTTPLPIAVISGMMGVPEERSEEFKRWSMALMGVTEVALSPAERAKLVTEAMAYFSELSASRRLAPGDDLISAMTKVSESKEMLSDAQVVGFCILLMVAGNETTTNLLSNMLDRLSRRPEDWAALHDDPATIENAIEESLRIDPPAQMLMRRTRAAVTVGGVNIPAGELVMLYVAASNRDPDKWDDAIRYEISRKRQRHLAFGHGVHTCIGAPLARIEAHAVIGALVARFRTLKAGTTPGKRLPPGLLWGFNSLPVVFE